MYGLVPTGTTAQKQMWVKKKAPPKGEEALININKEW
jgi:hypothetical protein